MESGEVGPLRVLEPQWNRGMILASIAISLLGTFTSTQLMCQARMSLHLISVITWTCLASLTFGFCAIWSLHFVAMLACELDLPIGIDVGLTVLSALFAVVFTFCALSPDLIYESFRRSKKHKRRSAKKRSPSAVSLSGTTMVNSMNESSAPLLVRTNSDEDAMDSRQPSQEFVRPSLAKRGSSDKQVSGTTRQILTEYEDTAAVSPMDTTTNGYSLPSEASTLMPPPTLPRLPSFTRPQQPSTPEVEDEERAESLLPGYAESSTSQSESLNRTSSTSDFSVSRRSSTLSGSSGGGLSSLMNIAYRSSDSTKNAFVATAEALYEGFTLRNILRGFVWSLAITSMHYVGIVALQIPNGYVVFHPLFVVTSALISWVVCFVGSILMGSMEALLMRQILFSIVGTTGVAAMHFTGMHAVTFYSYQPTSQIRGYPPELPAAIVSIAITTCILANGLLAHAATVSRNKLVEIVWTRRKLWKTIAQKENAEAAAAARSDFIASASHEIRTPLHHLQGYSDLLSRTELSEEGRMLLYAIQRATKTLSLITNNVLDWSKLERDKDALCRPVALDMRSVCESILVLLPNKDDEAEVEVMVVVKPDVPKSLYLDETYIHRILMNLLSNALKFTRSGYVLLTLEMKEGNLAGSVIDSGSGVPPSFLPELFEPFKQAQTRGSQRGTGLGLSIVKQLLHKMKGTIEVQSRHPELEDIGPDQTGSTFTINVPVTVSSPSLANPSMLFETSTVAMFHSGKQRCLDGLILAWKTFGFDVVMVKDVSELANLEFKYVWADAQHFERNPSCLQQLLDRDDLTILVPYDTQASLQHLPGLLSAAQFVPLQRPLMWHTFASRVAIANQAPTRSTMSRSVRFASKVDILDGQNKEQPREISTSKNVIVLLVEDNPINQKLGNKMLTSLGYQVLLAENGEEAIEQIKKHDTSVDIILMDQSMPVKDGVTATREIRDLEASEKLIRRHPIIAVTAVVNTESRASFKDAGADDFLAKPLSLSKLEQTLATFLRVE